MARKHLQENGYAILETNWRLGKMEADIIAYQEGLVVFVEVKSRTSLSHGSPESFVNIAKQRAYIKMADAYVRRRNRNEEVRFDIIAVEMNSTGYKLDHIENAFNAVTAFF